MLPESIKTQLQGHLEKVKILHKKDLKSGYEEVYLPEALQRKYPNTEKEAVKRAGIVLLPIF
ncbi:MAG: hypothetical protein AB1297_04960 [bacterium]